jgi:hypothetical protein
MLPSGTPAVTVTPLDGQPAETRQATGKYYSMYVPANFQEKSVPMANGEQMVAFDAPSSNPATPVRVAVIPDPTSKKTAIEQSYDVELTKTARGFKDLTRTMLTWPGAYCVCSRFPTHVGPDPVRMTSAYPPLPTTVTSVSVRIPNFAPVTVPVTR